MFNYQTYLPTYLPTYKINLELVPPIRKIGSASYLQAASDNIEYHQIKR